VNQEQFNSRLNTLSQISNVVITNGITYNTFRSQVTQDCYAITHTDITLVRPILRAHKTALRYSIGILNDEATAESLHMWLETARNTSISEDRLNFKPTLELGVVQIYTDRISDVHKWLTDSKKYLDLTKERKGIKEIFIDNIYRGTTEAPRAEAYDFIDIKLYQRIDTKELILVSNYCLSKRLQNKYNLLSVADRPNDCNFLILLGLVPAFVPEFKERLTENEIAFFKLLTKPVKVYHERASALLYEQIILSPAYDTLVREYKVEHMRKQFRDQEQRVFINQIRTEQRNVEHFTNELRGAEERLIAAEKELIYYQAGESKFEDAVTYIFEHAYLIDTNFSNGRLACSFRVPLSQWDPEIGETILKGLNETPDRYSLDSNYIKEIKQFIQYVILDQVAKYWILAEFYIDLNDTQFNWRVKRAYANRSNVFEPQLFQLHKAGPNPHLEYHACTGSYLAQIEKAKQKKDLPGLVESILAPYKNWNLTDGAVMAKMFSKTIPGLVAHDVQCLEYKGNMYSIKELHNILEEEKKPKEEPAPEPKKRTRKARVLNTVPDPDPLALEEEELRTQATGTVEAVPYEPLPGGEDNGN